MKQILEAANLKSNPDTALGIQAMDPLINSISGSRATLQAIERKQEMCMIHPENPYIQSGYENTFAEHCSSTVDASDSMEVLAIIPKFAECPKHHYYIICKRLTDNMLDVIERKSFKWTSEEYGFLRDNKVLDTLEPGYIISKGDPLLRSAMYDDDGLRCDVINLVTTYQANDSTHEDAIMISESAAKKMAVPLFSKITVLLNNNDIPTNMYGDAMNIKSFPWVGEDTNDGLIMAVRRNVREEALRTQTVDALRRILQSDVKYSSDCNTVIDLDIYCNNIDELLKNGANCQVVEAYNRRMNFVRNFITVVTEVANKNPGVPMSYALSKLYSDIVKESNGAVVDRDNSGREFKGTILKFTLMRVHYPCRGDKLANRNGGKGVISKIVPDIRMPIDEFGKPIECVVNQGTSGNRLNPAQNKELSINMCSRQIVEWIRRNWLVADGNGGFLMSTDKAIEHIHTFMNILSPEKAQDWADWYNDVASYYPNDKEEIYETMVQSILDKGVIPMSLRPLSDIISLDIIKQIYDTFECCHQMWCYTMEPNSVGKLVPRPMFGRRSIGHVAFIVLKQYAKEKYSAVCLANTNLRNTNTRSKSAKNGTSPFRDTPIMFGNMESGDFVHATMSGMINLLMVHSVSPQARMQTESMYTKDPTVRNIQITKDSTNRSVEIIDDYFKELGFRIEFEKIVVKPEATMDDFRWGVTFQWDVPVTPQMHWDFETKTQDTPTMDTFEWK